MPPKDKAEMMRRLRAERKAAGKVDYRRSIKPKTAKKLDTLLAQVEPDALLKIKG